ncbi:hypothetical protein CDAR_127431 [Caerostris darwini]|uniref:Uncharacterized protein n=1 Tax=Caerostris darwini TaxID=1538125 RepID=A0AAV4UV84_9ARAC|nr:hypothetical protein CDAR_127431 [Caerostris darwini]
MKPQARAKFLARTFSNMKVLRAYRYPPWKKPYTQANSTYPLYPCRETKAARIPAITSREAWARYWRAIRHWTLFLTTTNPRAAQPSREPSPRYSCRRSRALGVSPSSWPWYIWKKKSQLSI